MSIELIHHFEEIKKRKDGDTPGTYGKKVRFTGVFEPIRNPNEYRLEWEYEKALPSEDEVLKRLVEERLRVPNAGKREKLNFRSGVENYSGVWHSKAKVYYNVSVTFYVERPKYIYPDADALREAEKYKDIIVSCMEDARKEVEAAIEEAKVKTVLLHHAREVARYCADKAKKKAKEITRFDQRLAALYAELEAETKVQADAHGSIEYIRKECGEHNENHPDDQISERSMLLAEKYVRAYALKKSDGMFHSNPDEKIMPASALDEVQ